MCGRYRLSRPKYLVEYFDAEAEEEDFRASYNIAPTQAVATVRPGAAKRVLSSMRWGLIPWWAKDIAIGLLTISLVLGLSHLNRCLFVDSALQEMRSSWLLLLGWQSLLLFITYRMAVVLGIL